MFALGPLLALSQKKIDFAPAAVNFTIRNAGFKVNGTFEGLQGSVTMDSKSAQPTKIEGTIDANTIHTGINIRDNHLKKADYFDAKEYPRISMTSTQIKKKSKNKYVGNFDLKIKEVTKNIEIPFTLSMSSNSFVLKGGFSINRIDYKIGEESITLSDNVEVKIEFKATEK